MSILIDEQLTILIDKPYLLPLTKETEEIALFFFFYSSALCFRWIALKQTDCSSTVSYQIVSSTHKEST